MEIDEMAKILAESMIEHAKYNNDSLNVTLKKVLVKHGWLDIDNCSQLMVRTIDVITEMGYDIDQIDPLKFKRFK